MSSSLLDVPHFVKIGHIDLTPEERQQARKECEEMMREFAMEEKLYGKRTTAPRKKNSKKTTQAIGKHLKTSKQNNQYIRVNVRKMF